VEALLGKGYQVKIFDEKVDLNLLTGANKSFLERELPHIATLMCASLEEAVLQAEVVVIGNGTKAFANVPRLLLKDQVLIDLVGVTRNSIPSMPILPLVFRERNLREGISK